MSLFGLKDLKINHQPVMLNVGNSDLLGCFMVGGEGMGRNKLALGCC